MDVKLFSEKSVAESECELFYNSLPEPIRSICVKEVFTVNHDKSYTFNIFSNKMPLLILPSYYGCTLIFSDYIDDSGNMINKTTIEINNMNKLYEKLTEEIENRKRQISYIDSIRKLLKNDDLIEYKLNFK